MPTELNPAPTKKPRSSGRLPQDELVVGREALGTVEELPDAGVVQGGDPQQGALHEYGEVVPVLVEEPEFERVRQPVGGDPRLGLGLEPTDDQTADLLLEVGVAVGVAQDGQVRVDALDLLGDHVEVLGGVQGYVDAGQGTDRLGPLPGAVHDDLRLDGAVVGHHPGDPTTGLLDPDDPGVLEHTDAEGPGPPGQRRRDVHRVGCSVTGQPEGPDRSSVANTG